MDYPMKAPKKEETIIVKVTPLEKQAIQQKANRHTGGNLSQWIRKSGISYEPSIDEDDGC